MPDSLMLPSLSNTEQEWGCDPYHPGLNPPTYTHKHTQTHTYGIRDVLHNPHSKHLPPAHSYV